MHVPLVFRLVPEYGPRGFQHIFGDLFPRWAGRQCITSTSGAACDNRVLFT